ncbi:STAS domain-containing protein [Prauserella muralis]|uniref:Anti-sigma factor antagonist n=1 Tax=Prauserella muralis TaxID=588067 RepID=A0A2V4BD70_9PSEU|nr:STAS domain-containing protein [Prauserella muralis]PXY27569.1 anti-anti-sigma factor [Prauserella muralis]
MRIDSEAGDSGVVLAHVVGEVDLLSAPRLREWVQQQVTPPGALVLDLDRVGFLGSAGLSVLAELAEQSSQRQLTWAIVATSRVVLRPLEVTGLVDQMPVFSSVSDALAAVTRSS